MPRSDNLPWEDKLNEHLSWRGSSTGLWHTADTPWRNGRRAQLVDFAGYVNEGSDTGIQRSTSRK